MNRHPQRLNADANRPRWLKVAFVLAVLVVAGLVAAAFAFGGSSKAPARVSAAAKSAPLTLSGSDALTGKPVGLAAFSGQAVVVNFWSSSCGACFADARSLASFEGAHPRARVLGVDVQDSRDGAKSLYRRAGWRHPSIADSQGSIAAKLRLRTLPTTLFLDARHQVVGRINGQTTAAGFLAGYRKATR